jgi:NAD-dependent dihydropyrimidine dehydrogenase PreA subunit
MGTFVYLKEVVSLRLNREKCIGCGMCLEVCPHAVFDLQEKKANIVNRDACMECGACALNCPVEAIAVNANVGCARAVINAMLGRKSSACCCVIESEPKDGPGAGVGGAGTGCC